MPVDANPATIVSGATPIALQWSYNGLASRDKNPQIDVTVPATGRFGGVYVQAINKTAPHPNAAKLWMEYLYSDEGQLMWLKGYCNPIRYDDLVARGVVPADLAAKLPESTGAVFPTPAQLDAATNAHHQGLGRSHRRHDHRHAGSVVHVSQRSVWLPCPTRARSLRALVGVVPGAGSA